jgi:hypothetical protein
MDAPDRLTVGSADGDRAFGLQWAVASAVGYTFAGILVRQLTSAFFTLGAVVGLAQWLVLRKRASGKGWWILASAIGWPAGWILALTVGRCCRSDQIAIQGVGVTLLAAVLVQK